MKTKFLIGYCIVLAGMMTVDAREWTDVQGRKVTGDFVSISEAGVKVRLIGGKETVLKREVLATGEWDVAEQLAAKVSKGAAGGAESLPVLLARTVVWGTQTDTSWMTSWGSYNKTIDTKRVVEMQVRSTSDTDKEVLLEAIWLTDDGHGNIRGIMGVIRKAQTLTARETATVRVPMVYRLNDDKYVALGLRFTSGNSFGGWVMRVSDPETKKVLVSQGSRPPMLKWAETVPVVSR